MKKGLKNLVLWISLSLFTSFLSAQIPAGYYYYAEDKIQEELKTALHEIAYPIFVLKYSSGVGHTWEGFYYTDRNAEDNSVIDMYSPIIRYFDGYKSIEGMHIEHSFPKSWWGGGEYMAYKDLHHLFPSDGPTNMSKSNYPLGVVTGRVTTDNGMTKVGGGSYPGYTGNVFEPDDEFKGDFARAYLYIVTIYKDLTHLWNSPMLENNTYPAWKPWAIDLLMEWHKQDPVSEKELVRQEVVYEIQGNRNPFIDYPDLVDYIWGDNTHIAYPFPVETNPFLASPRPNEKIDFHVIMQGDIQTKGLFVHGVNITSGLNIYLKNDSPTFEIYQDYLSQTTAQEGVEIQVTFKPLASGTFIDTLVISGGGLEQDRMIPLRGAGSRAFMALNASNETPVGATLAWIKDPEATDYQLTLYEGTTKAGDLIISSYVEGSGNNKGVELYNGTGRTIDLSDYSMMKQSNGTGPFRDPFNLSGSLGNNQTYLIAYNHIDNELKANNMADLYDNGAMAFNGNDAIALYNNGVLIDMVGYPDAGPDLIWGADKTLKRKSTITHPSPTYSEEEWDTYPQNHFDLIGSHSMNFSSSENIILDNISTQGATEYVVAELYPESAYNYHIKAILSGETKTSINSIQFKTTSLPAPEANAAKNIGATFFTADWEADLYTDTFLLNVYKFIGTEDKTIVEGFDAIGANGKPLAEGWTGTASGRYTSDASSGNSPPSLQLKNYEEYVQTKVFPHPIKEFSFMYKFASSGGTSYFTVEALFDDNWEEIERVSYVNLAKTTLGYQFEIEENVKALRITFYKEQGKGNLAVDDFVITYGQQQKVDILCDEAVVGNEKTIENLKPLTHYYYTVKSTLGNSVSPESDVVEVYTDTISSIINENDNVPIMTIDGGIKLSGLSGGETISVYAVTGVLTHKDRAYNSEYFIPLKSPNIYILHVQHQDYYIMRKIVK